MQNCRRILLGWTVAALTLCAARARADEQLVTLKYVGTDVHKAISMLQTVSDLRVVVDPRVPHKRITLSLKDLSPEDALQTVVAAAGLTYRKAGNAYLVEPKGATPSPSAPPGGTGESKGQPPVDSAVTAKGASPSTAGRLLALPGAGIVHPNAPAAGGSAGQPGERQSAIAVAPTVLAALDRTVEVEVKNGPLSEVTQQLSHSTGIKVGADPALSSGLVATVSLHGIPLKAALELVAGQTGLQISPRPDGVAFVQPGVSLDVAQTRTRKVPAGAPRVEQGQLWTAEWANALTSGIATVDEIPPGRSLRRHTANPDGRPVEFKPRSGSFSHTVPGSSEAEREEGTPRHHNSSGSREGALPGSAPKRTAQIACPHCGRMIPAKAGLKCSTCGRALAPTASRCLACGGKPTAAAVLPGRCPYCGKPLLEERSKRK